MKINWQTTRYPEPLRVGDTIGITAPSEGVSEKLHCRLDMCIAHLKDLGFAVVEGACLRQNNKHVSASRAERVRDLLDLWEADEVKAILPPWGGELAIHLLPCIDFDRLATSRPKWILGYSDTSTLLFALTMMTGIATAHGTTLMDMIPKQSGILSQQWQDVISLEAGQQITLRSSSRFQVKYHDWAENPATKFNLTEDTQWRCMQHGKQIESATFEGRIVGGCLETLSALVGTPYGDVLHYRQRFKKDGLILFLENAESNPAEVCRMLWHMRLAGWFDDLNGLLLGRSGGGESEHFTYMDALHDVFDDLSVPIIYDVDIGHRPPQMTMINGALATVACSEGKGSIIQTLC